MKDLMIAHAVAHPRMTPQDLFKFLYQGIFGCEHLAIDPQNAIRRIQEEEAHLTVAERFAEPLSPHYCRVPLLLLRSETLCALFLRSAAEGPKGTIAQLEAALETARDLTKEGTFPFKSAEFEAHLNQWKVAGYPPVHHSEEYRAAYAPAYRVVERKYLPFLPLLARLDRTKQGIVALEGGSACGKSTLGELLKSLYPCTLLHMDDFFLRPEQRTPERLAQAGENVDWERFLEEVLLPLKEKKTLQYKAFDCSTGQLLPPKEICPRPLVIVEGAYSMHPRLAEHYDLSVFLDVDPHTQRERIKKRNAPPMAERFFKEWIPLEHLYFEQLKVKERCEIKIKIADQ